MVDQLRASLDANLQRVENLIETYESHPDSKGRGRKRGQQLDTLRAAVVFLHATIEDILRTIASARLPYANRDLLSKIPLSGSNESRKFHLGDLISHRGKTVDELLIESVDQYLDRSNFNSTTEIAKLLESVGIAVSAVNGSFSDIEALMQRRHQIVHRSDKQTKVTGSGDHRIKSLPRWQVRNWATAVKGFCEALFQEIDRASTVNSAPNQEAPGVKERLVNAG